MKKEYYISNGELYHYGIKGMKKGHRRFQNPDGSLTPAGEKRYGVGEGDSGEKKYELSTVSAPKPKQPTAISTMAARINAPKGADIKGTLSKFDYQKKQEEPKKEEPKKDPEPELMPEDWNRKNEIVPVQKTNPNDFKREDPIDIKDEPSRDEERKPQEPEERSKTSDDSNRTERNNEDELSRNGNGRGEDPGKFDNEPKKEETKQPENKQADKNKDNKDNKDNKGNKESNKTQQNNTTTETTETKGKQERDLGSDADMARATGKGLDELSNVLGSYARDAKTNRPRMDLSDKTTKQLREEIDREKAEIEYNAFFSQPTKKEKAARAVSNFLKNAGRVFTVGATALNFANQYKKWKKDK